MKTLFPTRRLILAVFFPFFLSSGQAATSKWVHYDAKGELQYSTDAKGNRIMDYSSAGYEGGGVALPDIAAKATVAPGGGDDTRAIQAAIDRVSALAPDANGFRGAVQLSAGNFNVSATLTISTSGVVLAGSGSSAGGTVITMTGRPFTLLKITGAHSYKIGRPAAITDDFVPSGALSIHVASAADFHVGDPVLIQRPVTKKWVHFMDMDELHRNGRHQTWLGVDSATFTDRAIAAISGSCITLDAPLSDSFDSDYLNPPGGSIAVYTFPGRISHVGVEHFSIVAPGHDVSGYEALSLASVVDGWVRDLRIQDTENSLSFGSTAKQITVDNVRVVHTYAQPSMAAPADFGIRATQILFNRCSVTGHGNTWAFATHDRVTGPVVLLECFADDRGFGPHQRWATGLLCDSCQFPGGTIYLHGTTYPDHAGVAYSYRGTDGSGHGWDAGWAVAWNVTSPDFLIQAPPGTDNWCIGCVGRETSSGAPRGEGPDKIPNGIYESRGTPVTPGSLYLAQLKQRLGITALHNIGYADTDGAPYKQDASISAPTSGSPTSSTK